MHQHAPHHREKCTTCPALQRKVHNMHRTAKKSAQHAPHCRELCSPHVHTAYFRMSKLLNSFIKTHEYNQIFFAIMNYIKRQIFISILCLHLIHSEVLFGIVWDYNLIWTIKCKDLYQSHETVHQKSFEYQQRLWEKW